MAEVKWSAVADTKATPIAADTGLLIDSDDGVSKKFLLGNVPLTGNIELKALATGLLKNTTTTGTPSIAVAGTDYQAPLTAGTDYIIPITTPASLADGASCHGQKFYAAANETLVAGEQVRIHSNGKMAKGKGDAAATMPIVATVLVGGNEDDTITCSTHGVFVRNDTWPSFTVGAQVFASAATAGALTNTAPSTSGHKAQVRGVAFTSKIVLFGQFEYGDVL